MANVKISTTGTITSDKSAIDDEERLDAGVVGSRRKSREMTLQCLYALELAGESVNKVTKDILGMHEDNNVSKKFARDMIKKVYEHREALDDFIKNHATNWDFDRIAVIDRIILRIAICEFLYFGDIPPKVSIDEAIELSKMYSTEKSNRFVNGILDAVLLELRKNNQLLKYGRGLQDESVAKLNPQKD